MAQIRTTTGWANPGVAAALAAAALFGLSSPVAKLLLGSVPPILTAGLLYLGSGLGLAAWRLVRRTGPGRLAPAERPWLAAAVLCGGVLAPPLLLVGLAGMTASGASLLLNAEAVLTALIAWLVFREGVDLRIGLGMAAIVAGALVLSWPQSGESLGERGSVALVLLACLMWAFDNNLTRRVVSADATWVAMVKGLVAGVVNSAVALAVGGDWPSVPVIAATMVAGLACYGVSLTLFVVALRQLGVARTGAYFSVAPFVGAAVAIPLLGEPLTPALMIAGALMALGVVLHATEVHQHTHRHPALDHEHAHDHDDGHHQHGHPEAAASGPHTHPHRHQPLTHSHRHYPDLHHRHRHRR